MFSYVEESHSPPHRDPSPTPGRGWGWGGTRALSPGEGSQRPLVGPPLVLTPSQLGPGRVRPPCSRGRLSARAS